MESTDFLQHGDYLCIAIMYCKSIPSQVVEIFFGQNGYLSGFILVSVLYDKDVNSLLL